MNIRWIVKGTWSELRREHEVNCEVKCELNIKWIKKWNVKWSWSEHEVNMKWTWSETEHELMNNSFKIMKMNWMPFISRLPWAMALVKTLLIKWSSTFFYSFHFHRLHSPYFEKLFWKFTIISQRLHMSEYGWLLIKC